MPNPGHLSNIYLSDPYLQTTHATYSDYQTAQIPKYKRIKGRKVRKGTRNILMPSEDLKQLQKNIVAALMPYRIGIHDAAHAYRPNRGIKTNALPHLRKKRVLRVDLKSFFDTVTTPKVLDQLPKTVPRQLRHLIQNWCFLDDRLPQGAPSSPFLSNIALFRLDVRAKNLADTWRNPQSSAEVKKKLKPKYWRSEPIAYTRYCDDLIFSSNYKHLTSMLPRLRYIIKNCGYVVNEDKVRMAKRAGNRQYVTGIVVNDKLSTARDFRKRLRSDLHRGILDVVNGKCPKLHKIELDGSITPLNEKTPELPFAQLEGQINFVTSVCAEQGKSLADNLKILKQVHTLSEEYWSDATSAYAAKTNPQ